MFRWYGILGILLIFFVELNFFLKIQPLANWYFPLVWIGYILIIDALIYKLKRNSLISNRLSTFIGMALLSAGVWWIFELMNLAVNNWTYTSTTSMSRIASLLMRNISFATVLPAVMETAELFRTFHLFDAITLKKKYRISTRFIHIMMELGVAALILPFFFPSFTYPLVWLSFFLILDPINYLHHQPSIIQHLKDRKLAIPITLLLAGIFCGFLWEFWNYWAIRKWVYDIPFLGFFKIFEMPVIGYLGYFPFAFELYALYWFARSLFYHKEHILERS